MTRTEQLQAELAEVQAALREQYAMEAAVLEELDIRFATEHRELLATYGGKQ